MVKKKKIALGTLIFILALCIIFLNRIVNFVINVEWFKEVGYLSVYFTKIIAMCKLIVPIFIISFAGIWLYYNLRKINR